MRSEQLPFLPASTQAIIAGWGNESWLLWERWCQDTNHDEKYKSTGPFSQHFTCPRCRCRVHALDGGEGVLCNLCWYGMPDRDVYYNVIEATI